MYHKIKKCLSSRSSHQRCSIQKAVFKNFAIFTRKRLYGSLLGGFKTCKILKKRLRGRRFPVNIAKFLITLILMKICEQLLLPCLLLTINTSSSELVSALNSIDLFQWSSLMFKEFSLGYLVVGSSLIWKKEKLVEMVTRCHLLSFVVTRCHSLYHSLSLVVTHYHSLSIVVPFVAIRFHSFHHSLSFVVTRSTLICLFMNDHEK